MTIACRNWGQLAEAYEGTNWCTSCVLATLQEQALDDLAPVEHQVFSIYEGQDE
jgi:hypothetical protein